MKRILFLFVGLTLFLFTYGQTPTLSFISGAPGQSTYAETPLKGKEYTYRLTIGGTGTTTVQIVCTNGTIDGNNNKWFFDTGSFNFKVKWSNTADRGTIKAIGINGQVVESNYVITTPAVQVNGPSNLKYGQVGEYKITVNNVNIRISSVNVEVGSAFTVMNSVKDNPVKIKMTKNETDDINNWIRVTANTSEGVLTKEMKISTNPDFKITVNTNCVACANDLVTYSIPFPTGTSVQWSAVDKLVLVSGQGTPKATFKASGNDYAKVKATISYKNKTYISENSEVWVGKPNIPIGVNGFRNGQDFNANSTYFIDADKTNGATQYIWTLIDGGQIFKGLDSENRAVRLSTSGIRVGWNQTKSFSLGVKASNKCGISNDLWLTGYVTFSGPGGIGHEERSLNITNDKNIKAIKIYNLSGILVYSDHNADSDFNLRNTTLTDGIYIIEKVDSEGNRTTEKISLKR